VSSSLRLGAAALLGMAAAAADAQDAARGAQLYLQLPSEAPSCVSCHGPDPTHNRNNILRAADRPAALQRALNTVGVMGYLRDSLDDQRIADLAAYLGRVAIVAAPDAAVALWPATVEFGRLAVGSVSSAQRVELRNLSDTPWALAAPQATGGSGLLIEHDCPANLAPGAACTLALRFSIAAPGPAVDSLRVESAAPWSLLVVGVSATGVAGPVGLLAADAPLLDFGPLLAGGQQTRAVTLTSHGTAAATLGPLTISGPGRAQFAPDAGCAAGLSLAPGSHCTLHLTYAPAVAGSAQATLQWRSDGGNPGSVSLRALATAAPVNPPPPAASPMGSAGGCSIGPPDRPFDPVHLLMLVLAIVLLSRRRL
jgi:cytochrome c553